MALIRNIIMALVILIAIPQTSQAWWIFGDEKNDKSEGVSSCGQQIDVFRRYYRDSKICKKDSDCVVMDGVCPLGCKLYLGKNLQPLVISQMDRVKETCGDTACSYTCAGTQAKPACIDNKCQPIK